MKQTLPPTKTKPSKSTILSVRNARVLAVQALYALEVNTFQDFSQVVVTVLQNQETFLGKLASGEEHSLDQQHYLDIVKGVSQNSTLIDAAISPHLAKDWRIERLGKVVRAILRAATYELLNLRKFDAALIINEYLQIAKLLNHEGETGFINKVLDSLIKQDK